LIKTGGKDWERGITQTSFFSLPTKTRTHGGGMCYIVITNLITDSTRGNINRARPGGAR